MKLKICRYCSVSTKKTSLTMNSVLDKDVQSMLLPLNLMQYLTFCPKYRTKDNFIISTSRVSNVISVIGTLVLILSLELYYYKIVFIDNISEKQYYRFMYSLIFDSIYLSFGFILNFMDGILGSKNNINFVLRLQGVHRFLTKGNNDKKRFKYFIICSWIIVISFVSVCFFSVPLTFIHTEFYIHIIYYLIILIFDINLIYATRIIKLLEHQVATWIQVFSCNELDYLCEETLLKKLFRAYVDILQCYDIYKLCFQHFVSIGRKSDYIF
ncbi:hypothetical protein B5X24_HaOG200693 [Helicoverpa armigera]|uniref:Gustatory receptor n=1 Tax=Helicoverpa armigera TaxID=29058 RepID=A0A2W1BTT4_HELAM|nr:hypothetical protein B5X24_HaOG200693 [Helicoverpa armigera]